MNRLQCEMCGSTDILKQDGVFVCQSCGVKYSLDEARKIMFNNPVEITGKVKIDQSDEISNWFLLAEREVDQDKKLEYYKKIYERDPKNWKAWFHIALSEFELVKSLPEILKCIDDSSKADNSVFQKGIDYMVSCIKNNLIYESPLHFCKTLVKEGKNYNKYPSYCFLELRKIIYILTTIADCVDYRFQDISCDTSIEIYKLLEQFIRSIVESPQSLLYLSYEHIFNNDYETDIYKLSDKINKKMNNVVDGYIPIKPLSSEELRQFEIRKSSKNS